MNFQNFTFVAIDDDILSEQSAPIGKIIAQFVQGRPSFKTEMLNAYVEDFVHMTHNCSSPIEHQVNLALNLLNSHLSCFCNIEYYIMDLLWSGSKALHVHWLSFELSIFNVPLFNVFNHVTIKFVFCSRQSMD